MVDFLEIGVQLCLKNPVDGFNFNIGENIFSNVCVYSIDNVDFFSCQNETNLLFIFKGSNSWKDWVKNFNFIKTRTPLGKIHRGFYDSWQTVHDIVIEKASLSQTKIIRFYGYSYGGAIATIAALFTAVELKIETYCQTFGCPKVGNSVFKRNFNKFVNFNQRLVNRFDLVIYLPFYKYHHVKGKTVSANDKFMRAHSLSNYLNSLKEKTFL